ncbi:MAG TPA: hypothetical protein VFR32_00390 [Gaiellaceae bacterium]|nr:hypothetical protein [Gaiellaceae bacterium]
MWRRLLLLTGLAAFVAYVLRRRPCVESRLEAYVDPADELRRKLDESRGREAEPAELTDDLDARRREVHDRARASADEMRGSSTD